MANIQIKDANGDIKYRKMTGARTDGDPYVPTQDVLVRDQTSLLKIIPFKKAEATTTLTIDTIPNENIITVASAAGFSVGDSLTIYSRTSVGSYIGYILDIVGTTITLDTPMDVVYPFDTSVVAVGTDNMNVDGSSTSQTFSLRPALPVECTCNIDITRIIFILETVTTPTFPEFGDIVSLARGIVIRKKDGVYQNLMNIKSNADLAKIGFDMELLSATGVGVNGVKARITFAGQDKMGVAVRIGATEDLEMIIQDNLTGITSFKVIAEGHIVE